jgi:hypothetical protein
LLDLAHKPGWLGGCDCALLGDFLEPAVHVGEAAGGVAGTHFPAAHVRALGRRPLARHGQRLVVGGEFGERGLKPRAGGFVAGLGGAESGAAARGIGQRGALVLGGLDFGFGLGALLGEVVRGSVELLDPRRQPLARGFGLVDRTQRLALGF